MASHRERTFIAVKPDGVQRGLCGEVIGRLERKGFQLVACKLLQSSEEKLKKHYEEHKGKPFFQSIVDFMSSGPLLAMVWEGENVVVISRSLIGETRPKDMKPGSLRGDFVVDVGRNIVHGSDSVKSANREIALWFDESELVNWTPSRDKFLYEESL